MPWGTEESSLHVKQDRQGCRWVEAKASGEEVWKGDTLDTEEVGSLDPDARNTREVGRVGDQTVGEGGCFRTLVDPEAGITKGLGLGQSLRGGWGW